MSVMPAGVRYEQPASLQAATKLLSAEGAVVMAGGQSLLAAMKLGLNQSAVLVDLQGIKALQAIALKEGRLMIGAMATHAAIAASPLVRKFAPGLCALARGIADQQVRNMGTLGGSLANNDPAACWPAAALATQAVIITTQRRIEADDFFQGLYTTALQPGEIITAIEWPALAQFHYIKFEQKASRFAMVGVALACFADTAPRVAITGLGSGVMVWAQAGQALQKKFSVSALDTLHYPEHLALGDLHASAQYRAHLVNVLTRRCVALISQENPALAHINHAVAAIDLGVANTPDGLQMQGEQTLVAPIDAVWQRLLDPATLKSCIAGCESFEQLSPTAYAAQVKVGLGPVSARFKVDVHLQDMQAPKACTLIFKGSAGALGAGEGRARVQLSAVEGGTRLDWQASSTVNGRLAQLGSRLIAASANKFTEDFFKKFAQQFASSNAIESNRRLWQSVLNWLQRIFKS
jgi:CO/xanthine dehydrogenase FAD-binding subunit/carbon monoxide dehydrogenase subunit G